MSAKTETSLVRAIGRWSLAALVINSIIGSGIFGLPTQLTSMVGRRSPIAVLVAGAAIGVIMLCFGEVASHFNQAGGPYLYARVAFGRLVGIETGWMLWLAQLSAPAANANLFAIYLGEFWPRANEPWPRFLILTILVGTLAVINIRGVRTGTRVNNAFTIAKLLPLGIVILAGLVYMTLGHTVVPAAAAHPPAGAWLKTILLLVFAYGGFETALTPMSEAKNPQRDAAFALLVALGTCTLIYSLVQWVTVALLPNAGSSERPLADVARLVLGSKGASIVTIGALISFYGYLSAKILAVPRLTYALAEGEDFPGIFAAVHARFRTPYFSILVFAVLIWLLAVLGNFRWNLTLSAVARLAYYGVGCAALPVLRQKQLGTGMFRLPGGLIFSILGVAMCVVLLTQVDLSESLILVATVVVAFLNWLWVRRKRIPV